MAFSGFRERVPFKVFTPAPGQGYRSDVQLQGNAVAIRPQPPITFTVAGTRGIPLVDLLSNNGAGARFLDGSSDWILNDAGYGVMKIHLTVSYLVSGNRHG